MPISAKASTVTAPATDLLYGYPVLSAGSVDREVVALAYEAGTNTASSIPAFYLIPASAGTRLSDGSYAIDTDVAFPVLQAPSAAVSAQGKIPCWPSHAKQNLAGRMIIPAEYTLVAAPLDANMNGTVIYSSITKEA